MVTVVCVASVWEGAAAQSRPIDPMNRVFLRDGAEQKWMTHGVRMHNNQLWGLSGVEFSYVNISSCGHPLIYAPHSVA